MTTTAARARTLRIRAVTSLPDDRLLLVAKPRAGIFWPPLPAAMSGPWPARVALARLR